MARPIRETPILYGKDAEYPGRCPGLGASALSGRAAALQ